MAPCAWSAPAGFDRAIETVSPSVVRLYGLKAGLSVGYGSGVLVSGDGLVVTISSLLLDSDNLRAVDAGGTQFDVKVLSNDDDRQLAVLRLEPITRYDRRGRAVAPAPLGEGSFSFLRPGDSRALQPGDWVLAAGNPFKVAEGPEPVSVTAGVFSVRTHLDAREKKREVPYQGEVLVIDAITSTPGTAGGPLVTLDGQWVGLLGRMVVSNRTHTNLNYAIPVEDVMAFVGATLAPPDDAEPQPVAQKREPYHGIKLFELGYQKNLVYVESVKRGSPAQAAGLKKDDLIVSVDGRAVTDVESFRGIIALQSAGRSVEIVVIRAETMKNLTLQFEEPRP